MHSVETFRPELEPSPDVLEYFQGRHKYLVHDYRTPDGKYPESCGLVAFDIAERMLQNAMVPEIFSIGGKKTADPASLSGREGLIPIPYDGRVDWGGHVVCVWNGMVFDPMLERPISMETYPHEAFGRDVDMELVYSKEKLQEVLRDVHLKRNQKTP